MDDPGCGRVVVENQEAINRLACTLRKWYLVTFGKHS